MKYLFVSFLLLFLEITLVILLDWFQGLGIGEILRGFLKVHRKMDGEDYVLFFIFFLPLLSRMFSGNLKNQQTS